MLNAELTNSKILFLLLAFASITQITHRLFEFRFEMIHCSNVQDIFGFGCKPDRK